MHPSSIQKDLYLKVFLILVIYDRVIINVHLYINKIIGLLRKTLVFERAIIFKMYC